MDLDRLPGGELIERGLKDLRNGVESAPALLVAVGAPRLRALGLDVPPTDLELPEHRLYLHLADEHGTNVHSRYNALVRRARQL